MPTRKKVTNLMAEENGRREFLTEKVNAQVMKRVHEVRKVVQRQLWRPTSLNPLVQAKLSDLLP